MWSFDFARIEALQHAGDWDALAGELADAARALQRGGADFLVLCTNTMHRCAWAIDAAVKIPCCTSPTPRRRRSGRRA